MTKEYSNKPQEEEIKKQNANNCDCEHDDCDCNHGDCDCQNEKCDCEHEDCCSEHENCCSEHEDCCSEHEHEKESQTNAEEFLLMAKRVQADFENYRKRTIVEMQKAKFDGMVNAIETILPALDAFKKANEMIKDEASINGMRLIQRDLLHALKGLGVEPIGAKGKAFDPNFHNALAIIPTTEYEDGVVMEEAQAGYTLNGKVIRYSQVVVAKNENKQS